MTWLYLEASIRFSEGNEPPQIIDPQELLRLLNEGRAVIDDIRVFPMVERENA